MQLRYIHIEPSRERYGNAYAYRFLLNTRFISNYLSREIRKARFVTDGTFNMISVDLIHDGEEGVTELLPSDCLRVPITFEPSTYERLQGSDDCEYYLSLYELGFRKAAEAKEIPLETLLILLDEFRRSDCKNEWVHKKKSFKEHDISVTLTCNFTTNYFRLVATIERISPKTKLCEGVLHETEPDEALFQGYFKDIFLHEGSVVVTDNGNFPRYLIDLHAALSGVFRFEVKDVLTDEDIHAWLSKG